ncbi:MAG: hypothetical protein LEGION0398_MBIBDBAK_00263 [Legionellaceae bacterium]
MGLTREQVNHDWFTSSHVFLMTNDHFTYDTVKELNRGQLYGLKVGLTREQVDHKWFTMSHADSIKRGIDYSILEGKTEKELVNLSVNEQNSLKPKM